MSDRLPAPFFLLRQVREGAHPRILARRYGVPEDVMNHAVAKALQQEKAGKLLLPKEGEQ